jgi:hypothetical protein
MVSSNSYGDNGDKTSLKNYGSTMGYGDNGDKTSLKNYGSTMV